MANPNNRDYREPAEDENSLYAQFDTFDMNFVKKTDIK